MEGTDYTVPDCLTSQQALSSRVPFPLLPVPDLALHSIGLTATLLRAW